MMKAAQKICRILLIAAFWFFVWWGGAALYGKPLILPSPTDVFLTLWEMIKTKEFYLFTLNSLKNVLVGLMIAVLAGILLSVFTSYCKFARDLFLPIMTVIKATPVASFIILVYVLIGAQRVPSLITFLIVLPVVWTNLDEGFHRIDPQLLEVTKIYRFSFLKKLKYLIVPSVSPYLISACRTSMGLAWKAGIAAEIIAMPRETIGVEIGLAKQYLESTVVFAWTLTVVLLSLCIEFGFSALLKQNSKKNPRKGGDVDHANV